MTETNLIREQINANLKFKFTPFHFIIDQFIRYCILITYINYDFSTWLFIFGQTCVLLLSAYITYLRNKKLKNKYTDFINPIYATKKIQVIIEDNIPKYLMVYQFLFGYIFSFWFFYFIFEGHAWYDYLSIILLAVFGSVFCILSLALSGQYRISKGALSVSVQNVKTVINENREQKVIYKNAISSFPNLFTSGINVEPDAIEFDAVDLNDTKIVKLESELKNITYKAEAWLLESVFLGGLAFSGFLSVASANFLGKETTTFQVFIEHIIAYKNSCVLGDLTSFYSHISTYFFRNDLYILIMLLCLLSSVFFLLILTLRLRLNTLSLNLDHILRIAIVFNAKEEEIFNNLANLENNPNQVARFDKIQRKINMAIDDAEKLLIKIRPVSIMMNMFRTVAIILFYFVLIISGFYFKPIIAIGILALAIFSFLFRKIETFININEISRRIRRH